MLVDRSAASPPLPGAGVAVFGVQLGSAALAVLLAVLLLLVVLLMPASRSVLRRTRRSRTATSGSADRQPPEAADRQPPAGSAGPAAAAATDWRAADLPVRTPRARTPPPAGTAMPPPPAGSAAAPPQPAGTAVPPPRPEQPKARADPPAPDVTAAGLPRRTPRAQLVLGSAGPVAPDAQRLERSADAVAQRLSSYQRGVREGRNAQRGSGEDER